MQIINKKSKEVKEAVSDTPRRLIITSRDQGMRITESACRAFGLKPGYYLHFLNEGPIWRFFMSSDPDGFRLAKVHEYSGLQIYGAGIVKMIRRSTGHHSRPCSFYLQDTEATYDGHRIIEVLTDKTVEQLKR